MTHLTIEQNTGTRETVASSVIKKLYDLAKQIELNNGTIDLQGWLYTNATYQDYITYLEGLFEVNDIKKLKIDTGKIYIKFEDSNVLSILATAYGDGVGVTMRDLQNVTNIGTLFRGNTTITKFNEFLYFTGITNTNIDYLNGDWFNGCTNLVEITIPENIEQLKANNPCFKNCTSLQKINFPLNGKLRNIPLIHYCTSYRSPMVLPNYVLLFIGEPIISLSGGTLQNIHTIVMGSNVTYIGPTSSGSGLSYPLDFIIYTTTPPTFDINPQGWNWTNGKITYYVPDVALDDYKNQTNWNVVLNNIKPISEYTGTEWDTSLAYSMYGYNPS